MQVKASGQLPLAGTGIAESDTGINLKFSRSNAIVFRLKECKSLRIKNQSSINGHIISRYNAGEWKEDMVVIIETVSSTGGTIIISKGNNAEIDLVSRAKIGISEIDLADVEANFQVVKESNIATKIIAYKGLTPLYRAVGIKKRIFREPKTVLRELDKNEELKEADIDEVDYEDFS